MSGHAFKTYVMKPGLIQFVSLGSVEQRGECVSKYERGGYKCNSVICRPLVER